MNLGPCEHLWGQCFQRFNFSFVNEIIIRSLLFESKPSSRKLTVCRIAWVLEMQVHDLVGQEYIFVEIIVHSIYEFICLPILKAAASGTNIVNTDQLCDPKARALFVFGDSYADTGNRVRTAKYKFNYPYGITWPGYPTGRVSDGHIQTDYLANQVLGIPSPPPYAELRRNSGTSIAQGINFAVTGAAMTYDFMRPAVGTQVGLFESVVTARNYSSQVLACSVVFFCVSGNDYKGFRGSRQALEKLSMEVVSLEEQNLRKLYRLGLRNIMVTTFGLPPWNCMSGCLPRERHNEFLQNALVKLQRDLLGINLVLLKQDTALKQIQKHAKFYGFTETIDPCCPGKCGIDDAHGDPEYIVCAHPEKHTRFDRIHPTESAWTNVIQLYLHDSQFTNLTSTLQHWVQELP